MAVDNTILVRRGSGTPTYSDFTQYELAYDYTNDRLYIRDGNAMVEIGGSSGAVSAVANGANNRIATFSSSDALNGESQLTFDGGALALLTTTANRRIEIGLGATQDVTSYIDLIGDTTYTDYGGRFIRYGGANAITQIMHRGTGDLRLLTQDSAAISLLTGSTERLRILSSGNVGIGTTSPSNELHVAGSVKADTSLLIGSNSNFLTSQLKVGDGTRDIRLNANHSSNAVVGTVGSHSFSIMTANTFRMTVDSAGVVDILNKMTLPASHSADKITMYDGGNEKIGTEANTLLFTADNYKYKDVGGAVNFELDSSGIPSFEQGAIIGGFGARTTGGTTDWNDSTNARSGNGHTLLLSTATNGPGADVVNSTNTTYIHPFSFEYSSYDNDGNMTQIGIPYYFANNDGVRPCIRSRYNGTWSNWHSLITGNNAGQIQGSGTAGASAPAYSFNGDGTNDLDTGMYRSATNQIGFATNGVQRMTIGNTALKVDDIHSLSNDNNRLILDDDTNSSQGNGVSLTGANHIYLCPDETNNGTGEVRVIKGTDNDLDSGTATELFRITNAGKVGITEDSIDANLHITGSPVVLKMERAGHRAMRMGIPDNSAKFIFADSDDLKSNIAIAINSSRNVGIGTSSPSTNTLQFGSAGDTIGVDLSSGGTTRIAEIELYNSSDGSLRLKTDNASTGGIEFHTEGSKRMEVLRGGDIKIEKSLGVGVAANGTTGRADFSNDVVAFSTSDKRLKENIKPLNQALDKVLKISGVEFDWKELTEEEKKTIHGNEGHDVGVIAQEIEKVLPEVVHTRDNGYKAVKYEKIVPLLIEAIKEQQEQINELKEKLNG